MQKPQNNKVLPAQPVNAIQQLIRISQNLINVAEKETQALLLNDMLAFAIIQHEKEKLAAQYVTASEEFRNRIEDFRKIDPALIRRLEKLQRDLGEKTHGNNGLVDQIRQRAEKNVKARVITQRPSQSTSIQTATEGA